MGSEQKVELLLDSAGNRLLILSSVLFIIFLVIRLIYSDTVIPTTETDHGLQFPLYF